MKNNSKSKLFIARRYEIVTDRYGTPIKRLVWEEAKENIDLGSINKPNKEIIQFKYEVPSKQPKNPLGDIFKGFGFKFDNQEDGNEEDE